MPLSLEVAKGDFGALFSSTMQASSFAVTAPGGWLEYVEIGQMGQKSGRVPNPDWASLAA